MTTATETRDGQPGRADMTAQTDEPSLYKIRKAMLHSKFPHEDGSSTYYAICRPCDAAGGRWQGSSPNRSRLGSIANAHIRAQHPEVGS